jgi:hypothetical protein
VAALAYVVPEITSISARKAFAAVSPTPTPGIPCPTIEKLDFEYYPHPITGALIALTAGTKITNQFAPWGITVSATRTGGAFRHAMIFNSASPTGGDTDLGTPNQAYRNDGSGALWVPADGAALRGPGVGSGGGPAGGGPNKFPLGKILIISEDGDSSDPDDEAAGGTLEFNFDPAVAISYLDVLDMDENGSGNGGEARLYNPDYDAILGTDRFLFLTKGDNSYQRVNVGTAGVVRMKVIFKGSGGLAEIGFFCP